MAVVGPLQKLLGQHRWVSGWHPNEKLTDYYTITNAGDTTVTLAAIDDPALGITDRRMTALSGSLASLAPGASVQLYFQTTNTGKLSSPITASADAPAGPRVTATAQVEREVGVPTRPPT